VKIEAGYDIAFNCAREVPIVLIRTSFACRLVWRDRDRVGLHFNPEFRMPDGFGRPLR
jgi:hypothetical protein